MRESPGGAKLLLIYDVDISEPNPYFRFFLGRYIPTMQSLGLEISEAWHTAYGPFPNRLIGFVSADRERVLALPDLPAWQALNEELKALVGNFRYKIVPYREGFQF